MAHGSQPMTLAEGEVMESSWAVDAGWAEWPAPTGEGDSPRGGWAREGVELSRVHRPRTLTTGTK